MYYFSNPNLKVLNIGLCNCGQAISLLIVKIPPYKPSFLRMSSGKYNLEVNYFDNLINWQLVAKFQSHIVKSRDFYLVLFLDIRTKCAKLFAFVSVRKAIRQVQSGNFSASFNGEKILSGGGGLKIKHRNFKTFSNNPFDSVPYNSFPISN